MTPSLSRRPLPESPTIEDMTNHESAFASGPLPRHPRLRRLAASLVLLLSLALGVSAARAESLQFDGVDDIAGSDTSFASDAIPKAAGTVDFWFQTTSADAGLFQCVDSSNVNADRGVFLKDGKLNGSIFTGVGYNVATTADSFNDGKWHHVAFVWGGSPGQKIYVDGFLRATGLAGAALIPVSRIALGEGKARNEGPLPRLAGKLAEVRLWNFARSFDQIRTDMRKALLGTEAGLIGYWRMGVGSRPILADGSYYSDDFAPASGNNDLLLGSYIPSWRPTRSVDVPYGDISGRLSTLVGVAAGLPVALEMLDIQSLVQINHNLTPDFTTTVDGISYESTDGTGPFWTGGAASQVGAYFSGTLRLVAAFPYTFYLKSDDGAALLIDGVPVIVRDRLGPFTESQATVNLGVGNHVVEVYYFQNGGGSGLRLYWSGQAFSTPRLLDHNDPAFGAMEGGFAAKFYHAPVTTTDSSGNFSFKNVMYSSYRVTPTQPNYTFVPANRSSVTVNTSGLDFYISSSPPLIAPISNLATPEDTAIEQSVSISDFQSATLTLTATSSNTGLVPASGLAITGTGNSRILRMTPLPNQNGITTITLSVTDSENRTTTTSFVLTVNAVNDAPVAGVGTALHLGTVNDFVRVAGFGGLVPKDEITVEFWQRVKAKQDQQTFYVASDFYGSFPGNDGLVHWKFGTTDLSYAPPASILGVWNHFAVVASKSGSYTRVYRNGVKEAELATMTSFSGSSADLLLGKNFTGDLAEFRIWNTARSESQIRQNMNVPLRGNDVNLVLYYRFNEGSGLLATDSASSTSIAGQGGAQNGSVQGAPVWLVNSQPGLLREVYFNLNSDSILAGLTNASVFPGKPDVDQLVTDYFRAPVNIADNYGQRISGWVIPPATGNYTFWISGDNASVLRLSANESPANAVPIASVASFSTAPDSWSDSSGQQSALIPLVAGRRYYIEALMKEATGGDHLSVGWQLPNATLERPIPASRFVANNLQLTLPVIESTATTVFLPGYDVEGSTLTYTVTGTPTKGVLSGSGNFLTYTPTPNLNGADSFTYSVSDGTTSTSFTVNISIAAVNNPPFISTIPKQVVIESGTAGPIPFTLTDVDNDVNTLSLSALSSDSSLVNVTASSVVFGGSGTSRSVTITPLAGESGTVTITITAFDGTDSFSRSFDLRIEPKPAYALIDMGLVANRPISFGYALNDSGQVVGAVSADKNDSSTLASYYNGLEYGGFLAGLPVSGGPSKAFGVNNLGLIVGQSTSGSSARSFSYNGTTLKDLGTMGSGTESQALAVNDNGFVAGFGSISGTDSVRAYLYGGVSQTNLGVLASPFNFKSRAFGLSLSNHVVGASYNSSDSPRAFISDGTPTGIRSLGNLSGDTNSIAYGINAFGKVVGASTTTERPGYSLNTAAGSASAGGINLSNKSFTIEFKAKRNSVGGTDYAIGQGGSGPNNKTLHIGFRPTGVFTFAFWANDLNTTAAYSDTDWHHWSCTFDAGTLERKIYRDGVLAASDVASAKYQGTGNFIIGYSFDIANVFDGLVDDVRVWTTVRTPSQIAGAIGSLTSEAEEGLLSHWQFSEGSGTVASDSGPLGAAATLTASSLWTKVVDTGLKTAFAFDASLSSSTGPVSLGSLQIGAESEARAINDFGQIVGAAATNGTRHATFYSAGTLYDLNDLLPDKTGWVLNEALSINSRGEIVGNGLAPSGQQRAFLAVPANIIGRKVVRPQGAAARAPDIELIDPPAGTTEQNAFFYSPADKKLYAIRPATARLRWPVSDNILDTNRITTISVNVWPKYPQVHIAGAPVEIEPAVPGFPFSFLSLIHTTSLGAGVDPTSKVFTSTNEGYSVVGYLKTGGATPDVSIHPPRFDVARTYLYNDPSQLVSNQPWDIGTPVVSPFHRDYAGRNGFVFFTNAPHDAAGPDKAYDRAGRTGPIIAVNKDKADFSDPLVVVWYATNEIGVAWAWKPVQYSLKWPSNPEKIVIASTIGSDWIDPAVFRDFRLYNQPDRRQPGFNPNEEHAFLAPYGAGQALFALRDDLNAPLNLSDPYALLKYKNSDDEWRIKVYKVVEETPQYRFSYSGEAGTEIQAPYPLTLLSLCQQSYGVSGPFWEDYNGKIYARAAGSDINLNASIVLRYFYPLQPDFWYDFDLDGIRDVPVGSCMAWLDRRPTGFRGTPIDVTFDIHWPNDAPVLQMGETLLTSKHGLPSVKNFASAQVLFDSANPNGAVLTNASARLYDPLSPRILKLKDSVSTAAFKMPPEIKLFNTGPYQIFTDLPYDLRLRLLWDDQNKWLTFKGYYDDTVVGEPLLLPNILSERERDRIKALDGTNTVSAFDLVVDALFNLTRDPNGVALGQPVNVGLAKAYTVVEGGITNIVFKLPDASKTNITILATNLAPEPLLGPKALTAGVFGFSGPGYTPGRAVSFSGASGDYVDAGSALDLANKSFTVEFWARFNNVTASQLAVGLGSGALRQGLHIGVRAGSGSPRAFTFAFYGDDLDVPWTLDTVWHHWACAFDASTRLKTIYRDGKLVASGTASGAFLGSGGLTLGKCPFIVPTSMSGDLDEVRIWGEARGADAIRDNYLERLLGTEPNLLRYFRFDESAGSKITDDSTTAAHATLFGSTRINSGANMGILPRFVTIVENNDPALGLPVTLHVIRVDNGPVQGDLKVVYPDNVFDEKLTLRSSGDFGGEPEKMEFEWYRKPASLDRFALPQTDPVSGVVNNLNGWIAVTPPAGATMTKNGLNSITIGDGGQSSLITLSDNWYIMRYRGYQVDGRIDWSDWIGDPSFKVPPAGQLAEGWIKRVVKGLNPFEARTTNFHSSEAVTFTSMLIQAGKRYEGDIALNPSAGNLNSLGLIESYSTVLNRGRNLSIDGTPAFNYPDANNALLLAASRVADLYSLLGNEAYADAQDPTIGITTGNSLYPGYGSLASSIFTFQNQVDSPMAEELALLRGRDDTAEGVQAPPVYNRLFWNFTKGDGEVAYAVAYNISDQNHDGLIDEKDAAILYPQGHGDAWGHYLTGIKTYYQLMRHTNFTWLPRSEFILVDNVPIQVDFLDERKFAGLAAARAKAGAEIVDLTYRSNYVDDPAGQWQGYKDTDTDRAWGVTEWAHRAAEGAYYDWVVANGLLYTKDPDPTHNGIQKIDRSTVPELAQISRYAEVIQAEMDKADGGLNPAGVAKGAIPFDIDPNEVAAGKTHFEQIYARALKTVQNGVQLWDHVNELSESLRRNQDSGEEFAHNVEDQERDYKNRMIESFGYPYAGDMGPGKTYPSDYDGPDLYHYMYANSTDLGGSVPPPTQFVSSFFTGLKLSREEVGSVSDINAFSFDAPLVGAMVDDVPVLKVVMPFTVADYAMIAPAEWGQRRAPGEIQLAFSDLLQSQARLKQGLAKHANITRQIEDAASLLYSRFKLRQDVLNIHSVESAELGSLTATIVAATAVNKVASGKAKTALRMGEIVAGGLPTVVGLASDVSFSARTIARSVALATAETMETVSGIADAVAQVTEKIGLELVRSAAASELETANYNYEQKQQAVALEQLLRSEGPMRIELGMLLEQLSQNLGRYNAAVAKGFQLVDERIAFRQRTSAKVQKARYQDMAFRVFRNDSLQKYRAQFDLAARYVFLAASAYDYEVNLLGDAGGSGREFLTDIVRQRSLGQLVDGNPVAGVRGLADALARMGQNFAVLKPQLGFNNPQTETGRFSLRSELFRLKGSSDEEWRAELARHRVANLWSVPEFRQYCRPFAPEESGAQPGLVIRFPTTVTFGQNFFGWPLSGGDSSYDPSLFATKVRSVGVWFAGYNGNGLSFTPRVYLVPAGDDVLRSPNGNDFVTRFFRVVDQKLPVPFPIGPSVFDNPDWIPSNNSMNGFFGDIRKFSSFRAYHDSGVFLPSETSSDSRLVGRSVWNTDWMLIIPGGTLLNNADSGLNAFISSVSDIKLFFQTYSYSGN